MKNDKESDYALNKYSAGIVYRFADGIVEVTLEKYLAENPDSTEADFLALKKVSDSDYLDQVQAENAQTKKNSPLAELEGTKFCCTPSLEDTLIGNGDGQNMLISRTQRKEITRAALVKLTEVQRRRYIQYHAFGFSARKIAKLEGSNHKSVLESLNAAEKKIKKFCAAHKKHPPKTN